MNLSSISQISSMKTSPNPPTRNSAPKTTPQPLKAGISPVLHINNDSGILVPQTMVSLNYSSTPHLENGYTTPLAWKCPRRGPLRGIFDRDGIIHLQLDTPPGNPISRGHYVSLHRLSFRNRRRG